MVAKSTIVKKIKKKREIYSKAETENIVKWKKINALVKEIVRKITYQGII